MQTTGNKTTARPAKTEARLRQADDPEQSRRFLEAARKAEADETAKGADRAFKSLAKTLSRTASKIYFWLEAERQ